MATSSNYRVPANTIAADRETLLALQDMHDYQPVNPNHSVSTLIALEQALRQAEAAEVRAQQALASARDIAIAFRHNTKITPAKIPPPVTTETAVLILNRAASV